MKEHNGTAFRGFIKVNEILRTLTCKSELSLWECQPNKNDKTKAVAAREERGKSPGTLAF